MPNCIGLMRYASSQRLMFEAASRQIGKAVVRKQANTITISRRAFLGASALLAFGRSVVAQPSAADAKPSGEERTRSFQLAYAKIVGDRTPEPEGLTMDLPELAENGNMVLFELSVDSPMTSQDHVKAFHLLSTQNPQGHVATFRLFPLTGEARVSGRMRLAKTQEVVGLAELSDGRIFSATHSVQVTIGGCGL